MAEKVSTLILKVDLECCRCYKKIKKVLCKLQDRENIKSIVYDEKNNTVIVSGTFNPQCLSKKLRCKACKVIKDIQIQEDKPKPKPAPPPPAPEPPKPAPEPPKPEPPPPPKPAPEPPKPEPPPPPKPAPEPPKPQPPPPPKPAPEPPKPQPPPPPKPAPEPPPAPKVVEVPYPYPVWPVCCWQPCPCPCYDYRGGRGGCRCCSCGREDSGWNPPPSYGYGGGSSSWCDGVGYKIVCEEDPQYTCTVM